MKRSELVKKIATKSGITTEAVTLVLTLAIEEIRQAVNQGEEVTLRTFGTFYRHVQPAKRVNDIRRGIPLTMPPQFIPKFKAGMKWKNEIKNNQ